MYFFFSILKKSSTNSHWRIFLQKKRNTITSLRTSQKDLRSLVPKNRTFQSSVFWDGKRKHLHPQGLSQKTELFRVLFFGTVSENICTRKGCPKNLLKSVKMTDFGPKMTKIHQKCWILAYCPLETRLKGVFFQEFAKIATKKNTSKPTFASKIKKSIKMSIFCRFFVEKREMLYFNAWTVFFPPKNADFVQTHRKSVDLEAKNRQKRAPGPVLSKIWPRRPDSVREARQDDFDPPKKTFFCAFFGGWLVEKSGSPDRKKSVFHADSAYLPPKAHKSGFFAYLPQKVVEFTRHSV